MTTFGSYRFFSLLSVTLGRPLVEEE